MSDTEDLAKESLRWSQRRHNEAEASGMLPPLARVSREEVNMDERDETQLRLPRAIIDFRVPIWGLVSMCAVAAWGMISMYFQLTAVREAMVTMQVEVRAATVAISAFSSELAIMKYRIEKLEGTNSGPFRQQPNGR